MVLFGWLVACLKLQHYNAVVLIFLVQFLFLGRVSVRTRLCLHMEYGTHFKLILNIHTIVIISGNSNQPKQEQKKLCVRNFPQI